MGILGRIFGKPAPVKQDADREYERVTGAKKSSDMLYEKASGAKQPPQKAPPSPGKPVLHSRVERLQHFSADQSTRINRAMDALNGSNGFGINNKTSASMPSPDSFGLGLGPAPGRRKGKRKGGKQGRPDDFGMGRLF